MTPLKVPVCPVAKSFATMLNPKSAFPVQRPLVKVSVPSLNSELGSRLARGAELKDQVVWRKGVHSELQLIDRVLRWVCAERNIGNSLCDVATDVRAGGGNLADNWRLVDPFHQAVGSGTNVENPGRFCGRREKLTDTSGGVSYCGSRVSKAATKQEFLKISADDWPLLRRRASRRSEGAADGRGEVVGEGGVAEALGTVGDFAGAVEDDDGGKSVDAEEGVEAIREDGGGARFDFVEIGSDEGFVVIAIGGEEEDVFIAGKFGSDFFVERFERAARATPGGPKIHD